MIFLELQRKTLFCKLNSIFPECSFLISDVEQLHPLICLRSTCHRNANCMSRLAHRVAFVFDAFPSAQLLLLYFAYRDRPGSQRAGVFWRDLREPRYITMNRTGWERVKEMGTIFEMALPDALFTGPSTDKLVSLTHR